MKNIILFIILIIMIRTILYTIILFCCSFGYCQTSNAVSTTDGKRPVVGIQDFTPNSQEEKLIRNCLNGNNLQHKSEIGDYLQSCNEILATVDEMRDSTSRNTFSSDKDRLFEKYLINILTVRTSWRESNYDAEEVPDATLDMVAPCSRFLPSIKEKWQNFFTPRIYVRRPKGFTVLPESQRWGNQTLVVEFQRPDFPPRMYQSLNQIAVDLVLNRASANEIKEKYGAYDISVARNRFESDTEDIVHRSKQASCATLEGFLNVLSLDISSMMQWLFDENKNLELKIRMQPITQIFLDNSKEWELVPVLNKAVLLMFSFQEEFNNAIKSFSKKSPKPFSTGSSKKKRSLTNPYNMFGQTAVRGPCRRMSYTVEFKTIPVGILYPDRKDIGACSGSCQYPMSVSMNTTTRAITLLMEKIYHKTSNPIPEVYCAPIEHEGIDSIRLDRNNYVIHDFLKDMVVTRCGCL